MAREEVENECDSLLPTTSSSENVIRDGNPPPSRPLWKGLLLLFVFLLPLASITAFFATTAQTAIDPAGLSFLAYLMVFAYLMALFIFSVGATTISEMQKRRHNRITQEDTEAKHGTVATTDIPGLLWFFSQFLIAYGLFYAFILAWATSKGVEPFFELKDLNFAFDQLVGTNQALKQLTTCVETVAEGEKPTLADFSVCLKLLGVRDAAVA